MIHSEIVGEEEDELTSVATCSRITPVEERRSSVYLTKYEVARIVGERARQIVNGTSMFLHNRSNAGERSALELAERCTDPHSSLVDPVFIAKNDLLQGRIPMIVRRTWPDGRSEYIPVSELLVDKAMLDLQK
ncbi:putative DNA-directed RNA polymerase subunit [Trypanosoma theileri]|uniref:Putative DNA-directed RNA polymerase subunit n=1 Tax=Trypanosoma theileri TaxID=67003 RepID=A0A1X0P4L0_9TRYP|nr:putative DNA-directed RNA polymerase subunit [Trypanosoma theileri]ORC91862.1 putative DNA-directed RNA polymerase subunit [Trypanosoma theileri]